jgi:hypothetical protein
MSETRPIDDAIAEAARRLAELLDEDFLTFEAGLLRAYPDLDADGYVVATAYFLGHAEAQKREFIQRVLAELES